MRYRAVLGAMAATVVCLGWCVGASAGDSSNILYYEAAFDLPIPADPDADKGWMDDAIIDVPDHVIVRDLDVSVSLTHTKVFDLQLFIESPSGTIVLLNMYDPFGGYFDGEDYSGTVFDDEATVPIEDGSAPFEGRFKPIAPYTLATFDGEDAFGSWRFQVYDSFESDKGHLDSFGLAITTPEPATIALLVLGCTLVRLPKRRRL